MDYINDARKDEVLSKIRYDLEEDLSSLVRISINNNPVDGILARFFVMKVVIEYCENQENSLIAQQSALNLSSQDISSLISEISFKKRSEVEKYYSGTSKNVDSEIIEKDIFREDSYIDNSTMEYSIIDSYEEENTFLENHVRTDLFDITEDFYEDNNNYEGNQDIASSLENLTEHILINDLFYKYCYSPEIFNLYLMEKQSREELCLKVISEVDWPIDDESITFNYFKEYLQNEGLYLEEDEELPSSFYYNDVFFKFKTNYHFYEGNKLFEIFEIEGDFIDSVEELNIPIVKTFVVFINDNIPHSLFITVYEPVINKFMLSKIYKSGTAKIISIGDSLDEVIESLGDRCSDEENNFILFR